MRKKNKARSDGGESECWSDPIPCGIPRENSVSITPRRRK